MDLYNLLFSSKKKTNSDLTDASVKRMMRKAGIVYVEKDKLSKVKDLFNVTRDDTIELLNDIVKHRRGKIIQSKDLKLLDQIRKTSNKQVGGNYDGWCDSTPGQCMDSISLCGGGNKSKIEYESVNEAHIDFSFPHKTFIRNIATNAKTQYKLSTNLKINLHKYIENAVHQRLLADKIKSV